MEQQNRKIRVKVKCIYCHKRAVQQVTIKGDKIDLCNEHKIKNPEKLKKMVGKSK